MAGRSRMQRENGHRQLLTNQQQQSHPERDHCPAEENRTAHHDLLLLLLFLLILFFTSLFNKNLFFFFFFSQIIFSLEHGNDTGDVQTHTESNNSMRKRLNSGEKERKKNDWRAESTLSTSVCCGACNTTDSGAARGPRISHIFCCCGCL